MTNTEKPVKDQKDIDQEIVSTQAIIHELQDRLLKIQTELLQLEARIPELKIQRNSLSPISQLPDEVLYEVFLQARGAFWESRQLYPRYFTPSQLNFTTVCERWRRISNTPQLWSVLFLRTEKAVGLPHLLRRSGSLPLDLLLFNTPDFSFLQCLLPHWGRLRNVSMHAGYPRPFIEMLKTNDAPRLESLTMFCTREPSVLEDHELHHLTSLRTLQLYRGTVTPGLPPLPCLTCCVIHPDTTWTVSIPAFFQSLKNIPMIEIVEVSRLALSPADPPPVPVTLPNLSRLYLSSSDIAVSNLFESLNYPSSATVAYACDNFADATGNLELTGLTTVCTRLSNFVSPAVSLSISQLSLTLTPWSISLAVFTDHSPSSPHISLSIASEEDADLNPILMRLCHSLSISLIPGLSLKGYGYSSIWDHIDVFRQFEPEVLKVVECDGDIFGSFKGYYQREPLFPQLRTLILQDLTIDEDVVAGLVSMLVERIHIGKPVDALIVECCTILVEDMEVSLNELVDIEWDGNRWNSDSDGSFDDESVQTGSDDSDESEDDDSEDDNSDDDNE